MLRSKKAAAPYAGVMREKTGVSVVIDTTEIFTRDLPKQLSQEVNGHIRLFAVTMLIADEEDSAVMPCAGTLSNIKGHKGIITARHVWEEIHKHKYSCLFVSIKDVGYGILEYLFLFCGF